MQTRWYVSLVANSCAIAISALLGVWWEERVPIEKRTPKGFMDYLGAFLLVATGAFLAYCTVYILFGYVPMSQIARGFI